MALFIAGSGWGLAFEKAKLDTFLITKACKYSPEPT
jgi:hypothetical protein